MAKKPVQQGGTPHIGQGKPAFWIMIFIAFGLVLMPPTMLILLSGMIPSIVAVLLNGNGAGGNLAALMAFNLAGVIPVIGILWERGQTFAHAFALLSDVYIWLSMFGGAGIAVFLTWAVPVCVFSLYELQAKSTVGKLYRQRQKLIEEWGGQFAADIRDQSTPAE